MPIALIQSSAPTGLLFWCAIGFCAGIGLFVYGFRLLQRRRLILDTPFSKIRSASMGMVEISGLASGPYTMLAPVTARPCYYYRTLVWEWKQSGKNKQWVKVAGESMHIPFFVNDNTGRMLIDPRGADLDLHRDFEGEFSDSFFTTKDPAPDNIRTFLARHGVVTNNKIKVEEFCIKPKNSLFILGTLAENPDIEVTPQPICDPEPMSDISPGGFTLSLGHVSLSTNSSEQRFETGSPRNQPDWQGQTGGHELIRLSPDGAPLKTADMTQQQKIAAALIRAGITNPAAWSAAGLPGEANSPVQVLTNPEAIVDAKGEEESNESGQNDGFVMHPPVVLKKGDNGKTFLISWRSQQEVARSLGWKCALMIWGGPILALLSLYFFLSIENLL